MGGFLAFLGQPRSSQFSIYPPDHRDNQMFPKSSVSRLLIVLATILAVPSLSIPGLAADPEANEAQAVGPDSPIPPRFIYAVTTTGTLLVYLDNSSDTAANWLAQA